MKCVNIVLSVMFFTPSIIAVIRVFIAKNRLSVAMKDTKEKLHAEMVTYCQMVVEERLWIRNFIFLYSIFIAVVIDYILYHVTIVQFLHR